MIARPAELLDEEWARGYAAFFSPCTILSRVPGSGGGVALQPA
jgi:hypothetical protein